MKLLQIYNQYRTLFNGEQAVVFRTQQLIESRGGTATLWMKSSREVQSLPAKMSAFLSGIYSRQAYREARARLRADPPDIVHAHNLYPLFSPSVLAACRREKVPVVLSVHNQGLTCPKADHLYRGRLCNKCVGGGEYHCVLQNCRGNLLESAAYATRSYAARRFRWISRNVTYIIALTEFARQRLIAGGYPSNKIVVLPNMVDLPHALATPERGTYVAFAGRLSPEKGADTLVAAARLCPELEVRLAGDGPILPMLEEKKTDNVILSGRLDPQQMLQHYRKARFVVVPSTCYEMCPLVILEAMAQGLPVIASRIGGLGELVDDGVTGLLFEPGNEQDLADKMRQLANQPHLCQAMGRAGRHKAQQQYSEDVYFQRLVDIYNSARRQCGRTPLVLPETSANSWETVTA